MAISPYDDTTRDHAIKLAVELGPAEAGRRTGISASTIASWCSRAGLATISTEQTRAAVAAHRLKWEERRAAMAHDIGRVAEKALAKAEQALDADKLRDAKDAALTMAILTDKAQLLSGGATSRYGTDTERDAVITKAREQAIRLVS